MLRWRLLLGVLFSAVLAGLCWLDARAAVPGAWLAPVALLLAVGGADELRRMLAGRFPAPIAWIAYLGTAAIVAANWAPRLWPQWGMSDATAPLLATAFAILVALSREVLRYQTPDGQTERLAGTALILLYVGVLWSFTVQLRFAGPGGAWGLTALASLLIVVKFCDIGAYTVGRLIGRHKLAPRLSPGKTIEGGVGGLIFATIGAWLALVILFPLISGPAAPVIGARGWLGFGITVGIAGMLGDLAESLLKRDLGRKDSSDWMPGFGGILDLIDSVLLGAPVAYLWWMYGL